MAVAGQMVVGDRRAFTTQILASPTVPDLTVVTGVYLYVLRGNGSKEQWTCVLASQTESQILATYAPIAGNNDTPGETVHLRPYLVIPATPNTPCGSYEIQVVAQ